MRRASGGEKEEARTAQDEDSNKSDEKEDEEIIQREASDSGTKTKELWITNRREESLCAICMEGSRGDDACLKCEKCGVEVHKVDEYHLVLLFKFDGRLFPTGLCWSQ